MATFQVTVPNVPGVPPVVISAASAALSGGLTLATGDATFAIGIGAQAWGLYKGGAPIIVADSVITLDYKQEWALSDYPVERGAFETYDKVALPYDTRLRFSAGSAAARAALLASIAAVAGTTQLFDVVTPDTVINSVNVTHYDYRRAARSGMGLLQVDVWCLQVNENATLATNSTAAPSGADQSSTGPVQTIPPTTAQQTQVENAPVFDATTGNSLREDPSVLKGPPSNATSGNN